MKKVVIIIALVVIAAGVAAYFLFLAPQPEAKLMYYTPGDYFVTNIKDSTALIKTTIVLELLVMDMEETEVYLKENNHIIRDVIVFTLRSKTEDELRSQGVESSLRQEIVKNIKDKMGLDYLQTIYFNDYVIQ